MAQTRWHIGCSGFHYKEWKEVFYPKEVKQKDWFQYYCSQFNTLELNVTFYRFPTLASLEQWQEKAPEGFTFSAKVPRSVTHYKRFRETQTLVKDFYAVLKEGLKDKLGVVLFQLPPSTIYSDETLERILEQVDTGFNNAIEFRHPSWWRADVQQKLAAKKIAFCGVSFPKIPFDEAIVNTSLAYYRFHGVPVLFHSAYDETFIKRVHDELAAANPKEAYVYFNNTASTAAIENARQLLKMC